MIYKILCTLLLSIVILIMIFIIFAIPLMVF